MEHRKARTVLFMSTTAFTVCFAAWVLNAVLVTHLVNSGAYRFGSAQVGWLLAMPILTGAISRVPLGMLTDRYGGRPVFTILLLIVAVPMFLLSFADSYTEFLLASLGFGLAGGSFAVGVAYVAACFDSERHGTALGIFGMGNAGAALTTMVAPLLLVHLGAGTDLEQWRTLPRIYAALLVVTAVAFYLTTENHRPSESATTLLERFEPLKNIKVWRFGLYYFLVFGSFVTLAQWLVPYTVSVYEISVAEAGFLAAAFSLPGGLVRAFGGWLSDRFGARSVMVTVFVTGLVLSLALSVPRMDIDSPGAGVLASANGTVTAVGPDRIVVDTTQYELSPRSAPSKDERKGAILPVVRRWQVATVAVGDKVAKKQLLARGTTNIYYPANMAVFTVLVVLFGFATGIGKAGVYKFIPQYFPTEVGVVGGMVGLIGAMGGFVLPPLFGVALKWSGLWSSSWVILAVLCAVCLLWLNLTVRRLMHRKAGEVAELIDDVPVIRLARPIAERETAYQEVLRKVSFLKQIKGDDLELVRTSGEPLQVAANTELFHQDEPGDRVFVLLTGSVRLHRTDPGGVETEVRVLGEGSLVGQLSLIDGRDRMVTATSLTKCELRAFDRDAFMELLSNSMGVVSGVLISLSHRLRESDASGESTTKGGIPS